ncbi:MAG: hypothetical protein AAB561_01990 [Patescibacteria group bacterium]
MNDRAKMYAVIEWSDTLGREPNWRSIADVTELAPWAMHDLFNYNQEVFEKQARQRVSTLVSGAILNGNWDGAYYIAHKNNIRDAIPATQDTGVRKVGQMLCELMGAVENAWGGTARLIVFYVEAKR